MFFSPKCLSPQMDRRHIVLSLLLISFLWVFSPIIATAQEDNGSGKVTICHNGKTIEVSEKSLDAHLRHGDYLGPCGSPDDFTGTLETKYPPTGKSESLLSKDLEALKIFYEDKGSAASDEIFTISQGSKVLIEITAILNQEDNLKQYLVSQGYNEIFTSEYNPKLITVLYPIDQLDELTLLTDMVWEVEQVNTAILKSGIAETLGDIAQQSDNGRNAFGVTGAGIKVGVLSDSYNTKGQAISDISNGDLPGPGNPDGHFTPVHLLKEFPNTTGTFFSLSDEGRAMLQIVHDVAPSAELAFHTAFESAEGMAIGVEALALAGSNAIVDDVTHITEPFFIDGMIARAVNNLPPDVEYISAAGNFSNHSYTSIFSPSNSDPSYHDFNTMGLEDTRQMVDFGEGYYTVVLQWNDDFYSLSDLLGYGYDGAQNDLDFILEDENGNILASAEDNNFGKDPYEILNFSVSGGDLRGYFRIKRMIGDDNNLDIKYIIFRGNNVEIKQYSAGTATIVGHPNTEKAIAVGAMYNQNAPIYNNNLIVETFSSHGGSPVNGVVLQKPNIVGPDGVSTTLNLGGTDDDGDGYPDFYGTSAAAPHVGGAIALLMEAKSKFTVDFNIKDVLFGTAADMHENGFDPYSGAGFIQVDEAMMTFAAPAPFIDRLVLPDNFPPENIGGVPFTVTIEGKNFIEGNSHVRFDGVDIPYEVVSSSIITAAIDPFNVGEDPPLVVTTDPLPATNGLDGGSATAYFSALEKVTVTVRADDRSKLYWQDLPIFTASVYVGNELIDPEDPDYYDKLNNLGLAIENNILLDFTTSATSRSIVYKYFIQPEFTGTFSPDLLKKYDYVFERGDLIVEKLPVTIKANDWMMTYGDEILLDDIETEEIEGISFQYLFDESYMDEGEPSALRNILNAAHVATFHSEGYIGLVNDEENILNVGRFLVNEAWMATDLSIFNYGRFLVNYGRFLVNSTPVLDIDASWIDSYDDNAGISTITNVGRFLVNAELFINNDEAISNAGRFLVNEGGLVNGDNDTDEFKNLVMVADDNDYSITSIYSINLVSGLDVTTEEEPHYIVPGAFIDLLANNLVITYEPGELWIAPAELQMTADDKWIVNNDPLPDFSSSVSGRAYNETSETIFSSISYEPTPNTPAGHYEIILNPELNTPSNYILPSGNIQNGTLTVADHADIQYLVSTRYEGVRLVDATGSSTVLIDRPNRDVEIYKDIIYVLTYDDLNTSFNIEKFDRDGNPLESFPLPDEISQILHYGPPIPQYLGMVIIPNSNIALLDNRSDKIHFINSEGNFITSVNILETPNNVLQNMDGVVVGNHLIVSEDGHNKLIKVDLESYELSYFRDLSHLSGWLGAIDYYNGTFYICQARKVWAFTEGQPETLITEFGEDEFNITGILVAGDYAYVTFNYNSNVYRVDLMNNEYESFANGIPSGQDIELYLPIYEQIPINGKIAFESSRDGNLEIYTMNSDGSNVKRLTFNDGDDRHPSWNPTSTLIAYYEELASIGGIAFMDPEGNKIDKISSGATQNPRWTKDGSRILFDRDGNIFIIDVDGGNEIQLTFGEYLDETPDMSPDGTKIIFIRDYELWKMDSDGTNQMLLYTSEVNYLHHPHYSPDGNQIIVENSFELILLTSDGIELNIAPQAISTTNGFSWSPDGTRVVGWKFIYTTGPNDIWTMDPDGTDLIQLTDLSSADWHPDWGTYPDDTEMMAMAQSSSSSQTLGDFTIYPNPVIDILTIDHLNSDIHADNITVLSLYDIQGFPVDNIDLTTFDIGEEMGVDLTSLQAGMYLINISDGVSIEQFTIIKE